MPIQSGDIKLIASKVMDDVPNGGGGPSAVVIQDGDSNSIFSDVTERQRAIGGNRQRQFQCTCQGWTIGDPVDEANLIRSVRAEKIAGQRQLHRQPFAHDCGQ